MSNSVNPYTQMFQEAYKVDNGKGLKALIAKHENPNKIAKGFSITAIVVGILILVAAFVVGIASMGTLMPVVVPLIGIGAVLLTSGLIGMPKSIIAKINIDSAKLVLLGEVERNINFFNKISNSKHKNKNNFTDQLKSSKEAIIKVKESLANIGITLVEEKDDAGVVNKYKLNGISSFLNSSNR